VAAEALKKWDGGCVPRGGVGVIWGGVQLWASGVSPAENFKKYVQICASGAFLATSATENVQLKCLI